VAAGRLLKSTVSRRKLQLLYARPHYATNASLPKTSSKDKFVTEHLSATRNLVGAAQCASQINSILVSKVI
jgi:hypothetical protein